MIYITVKQSPIYHQMTIEELLFGTNTAPLVINHNETNTRTYVVDHASPKLVNALDADELVNELRAFNERTAHLHRVPRQSLYRTFHIPKKSGGLRRIDAPNDELMDALRTLKTLFETKFGALYHTSAFAYVRGRSTIDAVKRHQANESKWFGKYDLSDFFGSTTHAFALHQFAMIWPFSEVVKRPYGLSALSAALELAFLNGGLPQGTPISPLITNVMMIPIDHALSNRLRNFNHQNFIYTRYADDFLISSRYEFDPSAIEGAITDTLAAFRAPFTLKHEKTRYGSSSGSNWNLGVMLNRDNQITVGNRAKKQFQTMLHSYITDRRNGTPWDLSDIQTLAGYHSYYHMVEGETIDRIIEHFNQKHNTNVLDCIKEDLR